MRLRHPALRIAISVGLVALVLWLAGAEAAMARLAGAEPGWLLVAGALLTAQTLLMALRWRLTASRLGLRIGIRRAIGEYYLAQIVNTTLPGGMLGDAARAVRSGGEAGLVRSAHAVMIERMAGQIAMLVVAVSGLSVALLRPGGIDWPDWIAFGLVAALSIMALALILAVRLARLVPAIAGFLRAVQTALLARHVLPRQVALGLAIAALNVLAFAACARATGTVLGPEAVTILIPMILTAMLIPLSVAGWGWREGAAAALFPLAGATPEAGVAAGLAFGAVLLVASLPGLIRPAIGSATAHALPPIQTRR